MIEIKNKEECCGCHGCVNICPKTCITMKCDLEGFEYPKVDIDRCINCNLCEKVCPMLNTIENKNDDIEVYACKNKNEEVRGASSSGGVFSLLSEYVIENDGVVFGASFNEDFVLRHTYAEGIEEAKQFRGAKYIESKIGSSFRLVKEFIAKNRLVLFSGTPCQISGLLSYLGTKHDKLILVDIACHGVASPLVFKEYIQYVETQNKSKINKINFRDKSSGWKNYNVSLTLEKQEKKENKRENIYMRGYLKNLFLRQNCYSCKFKKPNTASDITLGDYWGVETKFPDFDDNKGTSLVLINTQKGKEIFRCISGDMDVLKTEFKHAIKYNSCLIKSTEISQDRTKFFDDLSKNNIEKCLKKYAPLSSKKALRIKLVKIIKRFRE